MFTNLLQLTINFIKFEGSFCMNYKKIIILGKKSLVERSEATLAYGSDNCIVIPLFILDELEKLSTEFTEQGRNAKKILEYVETFNSRALMSEKGVIQKNGSILRIIDGSDLPEIEEKLFKGLNLNPLDTKRLKLALKLKKSINKPVIMISTNPVLRIKAKKLGIQAEGIKNNIFPVLDEQYKGRVTCNTSKEKIERFCNGENLKPKDIYKNKDIEWYPNLFLSISSLETPNNTVLARYDGEKIVPLRFSKSTPYGVRPKKVGQTMALEALMTNPEEAPLVIIKGGAGTGKTYMSLAVALEQTIKENSYERILVTTPTGHTKGLGYLPGDLQNKINPHIGGILDNLNLILRKQEKKKLSKKNKDYHHKFPNSYQDDSDDDKAGTIEEMFSNPAIHLFKSGLIDIDLIDYLRGRSITNTIVIIDETQNADPNVIKSIVTRASEGSKFIFLGDPTQIDNPDLNERYNGLVYLSEKMKADPLSWIISMKDDESVRSALARIAMKKL